MTAVSGQRKTRKENRSRVWEPSQADIRHCWDEVRRARIHHAEYERRALMQTMRHQGGDSDWMLELQIRLQTDKFLLPDDQNA